MNVVGKLKLISLILLFTGCDSNAQKTVDNDAINKFNEQLSVIEISVSSENIDSEKLNYAIASIENITNIFSYIEESDYGGDIKNPVSYNIQDWRSWLEQNRKVLKLDKEKGSLYIKGEVLNINRNPNDLFLSYISDLKQMSKDEHYVLHEIYYILDKLEGITKYKEVRFSEDCNCRFPREQDFTEFDKWYQANKSNLIWNSKKQIIETKN